MLSDLRFAFRSLTRSTGFTFTVIAVLALGIGLNTSMFSLTNELVLKPLPYPARDQLIRVYRTTPQSQSSGLSGPDFLDLGNSARNWADIAAFRMSGLTFAQGN